MTEEDYYVIKRLLDNSNNSSFIIDWYLKNKHRYSWSGPREMLHDFHKTENMIEKAKQTEKNIIDREKYEKFYFVLAKGLHKRYLEKYGIDIPQKCFWRAALDNQFSQPYEIVLIGPRSAYQQLSNNNLKKVCEKLGKYVFDPELCLHDFAKSNSLRLYGPSSKPLIDHHIIAQLRGIKRRITT